MIHAAKKIVIITEKIIADDITKFIEDLGASGYTVKMAGGKGSRGVRSNDRNSLNDANANIHIETIINNSELAVDIAEKVANEFLTNYSGIIYIEDVKVLRPQKFEKD